MENGNFHCKKFAFFLFFKDKFPNLITGTSYLMSFTSNLVMKSKASFETVLNASSSKSYFPIVTFAIV